VLSELTFEIYFISLELASFFSNIHLSFLAVLELPNSMELFPSTGYSETNNFTGLDEVLISSAPESYEELQPTYSKLVKRGRPLRGSLNRPPRTEELLQLAAEQVVAGASLRRVGNAYNIPRTTLHDYMMRKGLTSQRALKRRILRLEREMTSQVAPRFRRSDVVTLPLNVKAVEALPGVESDSTRSENTYRHNL
jgi:hypothetical protein